MASVHHLAQSVRRKVHPPGVILLVLGKQGKPGFDMSVDVQISQQKDVILEKLLGLRM